MSDEGVSVEVVHIDGGAIFTVRGELDMASAPLLRAALDGVDELSGPIVLDFGGVTFMDSSGLQVLLAASLKRGGAPGSVIVRNPSAQVIRVLQITDLGSLLEAPDSGTKPSPT